MSSFKWQAGQPTEQIARQLRELPASAVTRAASDLGWRFGKRGRPSAALLIDECLARYPHWLDNIAAAISRRPEHYLPANPLAGDIEQEREEPIKPVFGGADLQSQIDRAHSRIDDSVSVAAELSSQINALGERVSTLAKTAPVQFTINNQTLPPIEGQHENFPRMVRWLGARKHVILIGPASSGKTSAAFAFAKMMSLPLYAQPLTMDSFGVLGYLSPTGERVETEFTRAWINGGVFLWDELSMSAPEALGALNAALANGICPIPGIGTIPHHPNFYCIAADNSDTGASLKYGARSVMDGASLDRFIRIEWPISPSIEKKLGASAPDWLACVHAIREFIDQHQLQHVGATMRALIFGLEALQSGAFTRIEILEDTLRKGILIDSWGDILRLPAVQTFLWG